MVEAATMSGRQAMTEDDVDRAIRSATAPVALLRRVVEDIGERDHAGDVVRARAGWRSAVSAGSGAGTSKVLAVVEAELAAAEAAPVLAQATRRLRHAEQRDRALAQRTDAMRKAQKRALEIGVAIDDTAEMLTKLITEFGAIGDRLVRHREECQRVGRLDLAIGLPLEQLAELVGAHGCEMPAPSEWVLPGYTDGGDRRHRLGRMRELLREIGP
jgi:hypothetical protein